MQERAAPKPGKGLLARFKPSAPPARDAGAATASSPRVPFLAGLLAGMVIMFGVGKVLGGGEPEPARMAPEPYAAQTVTPATDTFLDQVQAADGSAP